MKTRATRLNQVSGGMRSIAAAAALIFASAIAQGATTFRYEAGDMSSMYQDGTGTTLVTAVEQPVGTMLDLSRESISTANLAPPLVLARYSGVSGSTPWAWNGDYIEATVAMSGGNFAPNVLTVGKLYRVEFEVYDYVSGQVIFPYDGIAANNQNRAGRSGKFSHRFRALSTALYLYSVSFIGKVRNVRVYEIPFTELIVNGNFDTDLSGWTAPVTAGGTTVWDAGSAKLSAPATGDTARLRQVITTVPGMWYEINFLVSNFVGLSGNNQLSVGTTVAGSEYYAINFSANGWVRRMVLATATSLSIAFITNNSVGTANSWNCDNFSIRALPGNHLTQATSTARPVLSARVNLLTYSEQIDNATWVKRGTTSITPNAIVAPDGTTSADLISGLGASGVNDIYYAGLNIPSGARNEPSFYISRVSTSGTLRAQCANATANGLWDVNLALVGDGWQRITRAHPAVTVTNEFTGSSTAFSGIQLAAFAGAPLSFHLWGVQQNIGATSGRYQRIASATDYDAAGFPSYLRFDGVDDCLFTAGTVNFSNTDKVTVIAGIQKNSDAATQIVVEFSPISTTDGSWYVAAPVTVAPNFGAASKGTVAQNTPFPSGYPAPYRAVLRMQSDIAAPYVRLSVNRAPPSSAVGTQGTGNFGNHQMFVGRRNNATLQWNGQLYTLHGTGRIESPDDARILETYATGAMA